MNVMIVGGGRTGTQLAYLLMEQKHQVHVLDHRKEVLARLHRELPTEVIYEGNATEVDVLERAGIRGLRVASSALPVPRLGDFPAHFHIYFATIGALIPGICEEIYFRGLIYRIGDPLPKIILLTLSALAFALWHVGTPIYLIHTFVLGMIWGALFWSTGRLAPSILAHVFANMGFGLLMLSGLEIYAT